MPRAGWEVAEGHTVAEALALGLIDLVAVSAAAGMWRKG